MKYLVFYLTISITQVFAQPIDCKQIELLSKYRDSSHRITSRMTSHASNDNLDTEIITEVDSLKNSRTISRSKLKNGPLAGRLNEYEYIRHSGVFYSKGTNDSIWVYSLSKLDSSKTKEFDSYKNTQFIDCQKVGIESIENKNYDIVETKILIKLPKSDSIVTMRFWIDFQTHKVKRTEMKFSNLTNLIMITDYYVDVPIIQKPENVISKQEKADRELRAKKEQKVRKKPEYKDYTLHSFISKNLEYPKIARDAKIEGTVFVKFTVEIDGSICDLSIHKGIGYGCDEAAMEIVKQTSGDWLPTMQLGKPVRDSYILPIHFKL